MTRTRHQAALEALGRANADGVSRRARATLCRKCAAAVVRGLDGETAALPVTVDPQPLSALGEFLAITTGRATFSLAWVSGRYEIDYRDNLRIQEKAPETARYSVVAEHRCGAKLLPVLRRPLPAAPVQAEEPECPF